MTNKARTLLGIIIESYMSAYGESHTEIFKKHPEFKELYNISNTKINEATQKSTKEKMFRHLRKTIKSRKKEHIRDINLKDRIRPEKTANNDPSRGGNRIHNKQVTESLFFIRDNINNHGEKLRKAVMEFDHTDILSDMVRQLIVTRLGGWVEKDGKYENRDGSVAQKKNWQLMSDGRLRPHKRKPTNYDIGWLIEVGNYCG